MCRLGPGLGRPRFHAQLVDDQQRRDVADALLHRRQADQVAVELVIDPDSLATPARPFCAVLEAVSPLLVWRRLD
jgi:hypothetical protein